MAKGPKRYLSINLFEPFGYLYVLCVTLVGVLW